MSPHDTRIPKSIHMFRRQPVVLQYFLFSSAVRLPLITLHGLAVSAITQVPNNNERMEEEKE